MHNFSIKLVRIFVLIHRPQHFCLVVLQIKFQKQSDSTIFEADGQILPCLENFNELNFLLGRVKFFFDK